MVVKTAEEQLAEDILRARGEQSIAAEIAEQGKGQKK